MLVTTLFHCKHHVSDNRRSRVRAHHVIVKWPCPFHLLSSLVLMVAVEPLDLLPLSRYRFPFFECDMCTSFQVTTILSLHLFPYVPRGHFTHYQSNSPPLQVPYFFSFDAYFFSHFLHSSHCLLAWPSFLQNQPKVFISEDSAHPCPSCFFFMFTHVTVNSLPS